MITQPSTASHTQTPSWPLALILALAVLATTIIYINIIPLGEPPDEWAHLTYVHEIANTGRWIPDYSNSVIINSGHKNYLGHPPLYYTITGVIGKFFDWDAVHDYKRFRLISALMLASGIFFWVLIADSLSINRLWICAIVAATAAVPMVSYLGGAVNNDNLAYLGVAIFLYGIVSTQIKPKFAWYVIAIGCIITFLTKATASLYIIAFFATWLILEFAKAQKIPAVKHFTIAVISVVVTCCAYYIPTVIYFHTPFPHAGTLRAGMSPPSNPISLFAFVIDFVSTMLGYLPVVVSQESFSPFHKFLRSFFYALLALPIIIWLITRHITTNKAHKNIVDAACIALTVVAIAHIYVTYTSYLGNGVFAGLQPRYYGYLLPGLFLVGFMANTKSRSISVLRFIFACTAVVLACLAPPLSMEAHAQAENYRKSSLKLSVITPTAPLKIFLQGQPPLGNGRVDALSVSEHQLSISGWAYDVKNHSKATAVFVADAKKVLGVVPVDYPRPDVARALNTNQAIYSGFKIVLTDTPDTLVPCNVRVIAQFEDGSSATIPTGQCN